MGAPARAQPHSSGRSRTPPSAMSPSASTRNSRGGGGTWIGGAAPTCYYRTLCKRTEKICLQPSSLPRRRSSITSAAATQIG